MRESMSESMSDSMSDSRAVTHDRILSFVVVSLGLVLAACQVVPQPLPPVEPSPTPPARPAPASLATMAASPPTPRAQSPGGLLSQRPQYALWAELDYEGHRVSVTQSVTYTNRLTQPLSELLFVVEPNRQGGVFRLKAVQWETCPQSAQPVQDYQLADARLRLGLPEPLSPGASIGLCLSYDLALPQQRAPFGYTPRQINLANWYPFIPPYREGQGWVLHEPSPVGEHLVYDVADLEVAIRVPGGAGDVILAGPAPAEGGNPLWRYRLEAARGFVWSASPQYLVISEPAGSAVVTGYVFPEHVEAGRAALGASAQALALYSALFGPYARPSLSVVEADFDDGMEYDGLYFLGVEYYAAYEGHPRDYLTTIAVHETAHQWWYSLVGNDQALEPWLDEALCTYSERLYYETRYPDLVEWWWDFRVDRFNPQGWVNSTIYDHDNFRPYVNAVYLRGARFLEALRDRIGDEAFLAFLRDYAAHGAHAQVTAEDFFAILARHGGSDLGDLVADYFNSP